MGHTLLWISSCSIFGLQLILGRKTRVVHRIYQCIVEVENHSDMAVTRGMLLEDDNFTPDLIGSQSMRRVGLSAPQIFTYSVIV